MTNSKCDILLVIVLYNERLWDCTTYRTLIEHCSTQPLFIYDNSPVAMHTADEFSHRANTHYISDPSNPGLSYAYNRAAQYATTINARWLLLLDQDTCFCGGIIDKYVAAVESHQEEIKLFAPPMYLPARQRYLSPTRYLLKSGWLSKRLRVGELCAKKHTVINSGMLIEVDAFQSVGGYNQRVPLDYSDHQFIERYSVKYPSIYIIDSVCTQGFSDVEQSAEQKLARFETFCSSLRNCERRGALSSLEYFMVVLKRTVSLCLSLRSLRPVSIVAKYYF